ncbi:DNA-binding protein RFX6, partial [Poecilia latipinna]|uniref:DNA-binding protein RFX6 n=1 Tax=Poecilia latipinna TaxID=48699 RepID=UPI00072E812C
PDFYSYKTKIAEINLKILFAGFYGNSSFLASQRVNPLVDQHVSVISSVGSLRPFSAAYSEVHDPLNILDEPGRKTSGSFFSEAESGTGHPLPASGSATCMFGLPSPFSSQDALTSLQRGAASSEVQDLVSSLPPINTVFMGGAQ